MTDPRIDRLAEVLVRYSTGVRPRDLVSLVGPPLAEPLLVALYREVLRAGANPVFHIVPEACTEVLYREGDDDQVAFVSPLEQCEVDSADVVIHTLAPLNTRALTGIPASRQALRSRARGPLMERFLQRAAEKKLRWVVTQLPCQASAQDAEMSLAEYADFVFRAGLLHRPDPATAWRELSQGQAQLAAFLDGVHELRFVTPRGTDLRVQVAGRAWINCDGHENFPDGEVFTGPIENATEGSVRFDFPAVHGGREVQGVRLVFRAGRVVGASADKGEDFLVGMLDQDAGARVLAQLPQLGLQNSDF